MPMSVVQDNFGVVVTGHRFSVIVTGHSLKDVEGVRCGERGDSRGSRASRVGGGGERFREEPVAVLVRERYDAVVGSKENVLLEAGDVSSFEKLRDRDEGAGDIRVIHGVRETDIDGLVVLVACANREDTRGGGGENGGCRMDLSLGRDDV